MKSPDKKKAKELDWEMRLENILGNRKDIIDELVGKIPDEQVIKSLKYFDETKRQLDELISSLLQKQRTELLDWINQNYISKEQILNLECLKEEELIDDTKVDCMILEKTWEDNDLKIIRNNLRKEIKEEIKKI